MTNSESFLNDMKLAVDSAVKNEQDLRVLRGLVEDIAVEVLFSEKQTIKKSLLKDLFKAHGLDVKKIYEKGWF